MVVANAPRTITAIATDAILATESWDQACAHVYESVLIPLADLSSISSEPDALAAIIRAGIRAQVSNVGHQERRTIIENCSTYDANATAEQRMGLESMGFNHLLDYPLHNGLRLGDARKADVDEHAGILRSRVRATLVRAAWMDLISSKLKADQTVRGAVSEADLRSLLAQAEARTKPAK